MMEELADASFHYAYASACCGSPITTTDRWRMDRSRSVVMGVAEIDIIKREVFERLREFCLTLEVKDEIESRLCEFANALSNNDIKSLLRTVTLLHNLVSELTGNEDAEGLCDRLQELIPTRIKTSALPLARKELFFVWIGRISNRSLQTISIWKQANPQYEVKLWFDSHCLLASHYSRLMKDLRGLNLSTNGDLIRFQNKAYADLKLMFADGCSFDEALIEFFLRIGFGHISRELELELEKAKRRYRDLAAHFSLRDVQDHAAEIMDDEFRHYYMREVALRGNLAAASDILRLHVIQHYGGMYIDCDTLPSLSHVFTRTDSYCRRQDISFSFIDVLKSELYVRQIAPLLSFAELDDDPSADAPTRQSDMQVITDHLRSHHGEIVDLIEQDARALTPESAFRPLDEIWLFDQGLLLTGDPYNRNCFNNNVVIANPHSKAIKVILLEMRRRYRYLNRMGVVDIASENELPSEDSYYGRLLNYRFDALDQQENVTVILTGPGLMFEVIMGLGFRLLRLDDQVSPASLAYALYSQKIGIAFMDQTFHTYDHSQSTWMRDPDEHTLTV